MAPRKLIIIGSGPAGLTAALYAARATLQPLVITGYEVGGQLTTTTDVENFPGFPEGIQGPELMENMKKQAARFGAEYVNSAVSEVDFSGRPLRVKVDDTWYESEAVILATGASAKYLGLESEKRLLGYGVSSCATCDGYFFRDGNVVVVGGGDSAMEEALFLANLAASVTVIHRRDELRASRIMQERALNHPKIKFIWNTVVEEILGENEVKGIRMRNVQTNEESELACDAVFIAIGHTPNTKFLGDAVELDEAGYIKVYPGMRTSVEGVFVAGDAHDKVYRQAITAAADGCKAALEVERWLSQKEASTDTVVSQ